ncbi:hypothetical protein TL16_g05069 [Triparma laevis f. inornata]|uniref:Histone-lysine N-methyltransferase, H3 lysine-79 specific n=1 Tax=Triparma laevis f. inornata TaxID=1714386 RepID=A0A9W7AH34_9STRA|nr:hypothetical protein TL16_g05069 [Triparma laevis f. inornata]
MIELTLKTYSEGSDNDKMSRDDSPASEPGQSEPQANLDQELEQELKPDVSRDVSPASEAGQSEPHAKLDEELEQELKPYALIRDSPGGKRKFDALDVDLAPVQSVSSPAHNDVHNNVDVDAGGDAGGDRGGTRDTEFDDDFGDSNDDNEKGEKAKTSRIEMPPCSQKKRKWNEEEGPAPAPAPAPVIQLIDSDSETNNEPTIAGTKPASPPASAPAPAPAPAPAAAASEGDELLKRVMAESVSTAEREAAARKRADEVQFISLEPLTTDEFVSLWRTTEEVTGVAMTDIEAGGLVRTGNAAGSVSGVTQDRAQYGRLFFGATQKIAELTDLKASEIFVDVGSGVGNAPMQMACTVGCESRGIELMPDRHIVGHGYMWPAIEQAISERDGAPPRVGEVDLRQADLADAAVADFMSSADIAFVNNYNEIFGARSCKPGERSLDEHIARVFAAMKPGSRMVTFHPLVALGMDVAQANALRQDRGLDTCDDASFFRAARSTLEPGPTAWAPAGENVVSWSDGPIVAYLYTRTAQSLDKACFLCTCRDCPGAAEPTAFVDEDSLDLVTECVFCSESRRSAVRANRGGGGRR